jgi:tetratricopeptide (TPR) repeat protein
MAKMNPRLIPLVFLPFLVLVAASAMRPACAQSETRLALVIGNAGYEGDDTPLKDPVSNARALGEQLGRLGFDVDVGENLGKEAMRSAIERFYGKIKPGSAALIFFSGYAIQSERQTYMIPVNASIWTEPYVRRDGFSLDRVLAEMDSKGARVKIAILDASRANLFERRFRPVPGGLAPVIAPNNTAVMYAAAPSKVVRDREGSLFVSELLKEIRNPGKIEEVFNRTLASVSRESRGEQSPWFSSSLVDPFSFVTTTASRPQPETPRPTPKAPEPEKKAEPEKKTDPDADARREYQAAERAGTRQAFQDFLARYPSGRYAALARERIEKLEPAPPPPRTDPDAEVRRDYQYAERLGTRNGWEDFLAKHPSGAYSELARDRLAKLEPAPPPKPDARLEDPAIQELDRRIQRNPNDAPALYKRGQLYAQHGDFGRAVKDFDQVLRMNPRDAEALNNRCWARAILGDLQPALKDCNDALQIRPRYLDALDSRGFVSLKLGQPSKAIADYDLALQINPKHASSLYGRGIAKVRSGNAPAGNSDIAAAKTLQPDIVEEFASYGISGP